MKLSDLKSVLRSHPGTTTRFILPDGQPAPAHFHISEVGHVARRAVDCGGTVHEAIDTCVLQTFVANDFDHRLDGETFAQILDLGRSVLPSEEIEVEVEYDNGNATQYPVRDAQLSGPHLEIRLEGKHTDCAAKEKCGIDPSFSSGGCC